MEKPIQVKCSNLNLYLVTCAVNLATVTAGCTLTWTSPTLPKLTVPNDRLTITKEEGAWIGSFLPLGGCLGPVLATLIVDAIGKKLSLFLCTLMILFHWIIIAVINSLEAIYLARFIAGMAVGTIFNLITVYVAEISSDETRGATGSLFLLFLYTGCNIPYIIGPFTSVLTLIVVVASISIFTMILLIWIPETPHYLLDKGKKQKAYAALQLLRTYPNKLIIQKEIAELQEMLDKSHREKLHTGSMIIQVTRPTSLKSIYYGSALIFFQQMAGFNAVVFYSEDIFKKATSSISPSVATIICGMVMLFSGALVPAVGKLVRIKYVLYFSSTGCLFFLTILGIYFKAQDTVSAIESFSWVPVLCVIGYILSHSIGLGSYSWVILAEIFKPSLKTVSSAFITSLCWFLCFFITRFFTTFVDLLGCSGTFWLFAGFCFLALLFLIVQLPDTQGKSLQQIQDLIAGKKCTLPDEELR